MEFPNIKKLLILTILLAISLIIVSVAGAFFPDTYEREVPSMAAQGAGQDLVDLFLAVPLLLLTFYYMTRGRKMAALVYGGVLFYILYSFVIYSMGVHFNRLFLLYCSTLGLSLYAFILFMMGIRKTHISSWFRRAPVRLVSIYLSTVAVIFYVLWLRSVIPALVENTIPRDVADYELLVNPVHVIDMAFALPALIIGSFLLWKKEDLGYIIAATGLVFMIMLTIALTGMVLMLVAREISEDFTVAGVFGLLTLTSLVVSILFFRSLRSAGEG